MTTPVCYDCGEPLDQGRQGLHCPKCGLSATLAVLGVDPGRVRAERCVMTVPVCVVCGTLLERDCAGLYCPKCYPTAGDILDRIAAQPTLPPDATMDERLADLAEQGIDGPAFMERIRRLVRERQP